MEELLRQFYENKPELEAVKIFFKETVKKVALERLFEGKTDLAIACAEANKVVDKAFNQLDDMFKPIIKSKLTNKAR